MVGWEATAIEGDPPERVILNICKQCNTAFRNAAYTGTTCAIKRAIFLSRAAAPVFRAADAPHTDDHGM